jgi:hypothetical protein
MKRVAKLKTLPPAKITRGSSSKGVIPFHLATEGRQRDAHEAILRFVVIA